MNKSAVILRIAILIILTALSIIVGIEVFNRFDGGFFSHQAVPIGYSLLFILLLIGVGITLGYIIEGKSVITTLILLWPVVQIIIMVLFLILGIFLNVLMFVALYPLIVWPVNLIGESISLGFQINRILLRKDRDELSKVLLGVLINVSIIIYVIYEISKDFLANLYM